MKISAARRPEITPPNCRASFNIAISLLSPFFFGLLLGCYSTCQFVNAHVSPNLHPGLDLYLRHSGGCRKIARWSCVFTFKVLPARRSKWLPRWTATSRSPSFQTFSPIFFQPAAQKTGWTLVSFLHAYSHRVGNYSCLHSNTVLSLAIASILPILSERYFDLCDS